MLVFISCMQYYFHLLIFCDRMNVNVENNWFHLCFFFFLFYFVILIFYSVGLVCAVCLCFDGEGEIFYDA